MSAGAKAKAVVRARTALSAVRAWLVPKKPEESSLVRELCDATEALLEREYRHASPGLGEIPEPMSEEHIYELRELAKQARSKRHSSLVRMTPKELDAMLDELERLRAAVARLSPVEHASKMVWDVGELPPGASTWRDVNVPGARVHDYTRIDVEPKLPECVSARGDVIAPDMLRVRITNDGEASVELCPLFLTIGSLRPAGVGS